MNDALALFLAIVLGAAVLVALMEVLWLLFSGYLERAREAAVAWHGRTVLVGLVNLVLVSILGIAFQALAESLNVDLLRLPMLFLLALLGVGVSLGLSVISLLIGIRLLPQSNNNARVAMGALVMGLACLTPYLGWFVLLPYLVSRGVGGLILALFRPAEAEPAE